jgi:hypothetical protein
MPACSPTRSFSRPQATKPLPTIARRYTRKLLGSGRMAGSRCAGSRRNHGHEALRAAPARCGVQVRRTTAKSTSRLAGEKVLGGARGRKGLVGACGGRGRSVARGWRRDSGQDPWRVPASPPRVRNGWGGKRVRWVFFLWQLCGTAAWRGFGRLEREKSV